MKGLELLHVSHCDWTMANTLEYLFWDFITFLIFIVIVMFVWRCKR